MLNDGLMGDHLAISMGPFTGPLNPLKTGVSRGPPGLAGGPGPLGPHGNLTIDIEPIDRHAVADLCDAASVEVDERRGCSLTVMSVCMFGPNSLKTCRSTSCFLTSSQLTHYICSGMAVDLPQLGSVARLQGDSLDIGYYLKNVKNLSV